MCARARILNVRCRQHVQVRGTERRTVERDRPCSRAADCDGTRTRCADLRQFRVRDREVTGTGGRHTHFKGMRTATRAVRQGNIAARGRDLVSVACVTGADHQVVCRDGDITAGGHQTGSRIRTRAVVQRQGAGARIHRQRTAARTHVVSAQHRDTATDQGKVGGASHTKCRSNIHGTRGTAANHDIGKA